MKLGREKEAFTDDLSLSLGYIIRPTDGSTGISHRHFELASMVAGHP
jgi:hypothetical protein